MDGRVDGLMGVNIQLFGLATCQNTHGGPFVARGRHQPVGLLEVCNGPPLAAYSFWLQIDKLRRCPELAPGTFLEYCKVGWYVMACPRYPAYRPPPDRSLSWRLAGSPGKLLLRPQHCGISDKGPV